MQKQAEVLKNSVKYWSRLLMTFEMQQTQRTKWNLQSLNFATVQTVLKIADFLALIDYDALQRISNVTSAICKLNIWWPCLPELAFRVIHCTGIKNQETKVLPWFIVFGIDTTALEGEIQQSTKTSIDAVKDKWLAPYENIKHSLFESCDYPASRSELIIRKVVGTKKRNPEPRME